MKKFLKATALTLSASAVLGISAFAAAPEAIYPVRETLEGQGYTVTYSHEGKSVAIERDGFKADEKIGEDIFYIDFLNDGVTYAKESFFNEIYTEFNKMNIKTVGTVKEIGEGYILADTETNGEVMFLYDDKTNFHHEINKRLYRVDDVEVGMKLTFMHSQAMTMSLPPQTYAAEVIFTDEAEELQNITVDVTVKEVGEEYFLASSADGDIRFNVSEETNIHHYMNKRAYRLPDLTEGMKLTVTHSPAMTFSLPPQTAAIEVVITE